MRHPFLLILLVLFMAVWLVPDSRSGDISASTMVTMEITGMT